MQFFWLTQSLYTLTNGFNKMAFLALYYRLFPMKRFRQACLVLGAISVGWTISYVFVCIFQCTPVPRVYNRKLEGTCINFIWHRYVALWTRRSQADCYNSWSNAVLNILTDLAIFLLPMPIILKLNMSIGSRIGLVALFSIGFFICLTTALRMAALPLSLKATEPTWESAPTNLWSFIEAATGVICACLLSLRKSIGALWPKKWRSNKGNSGAYEQYGISGSGGLGLGVSRPCNGTGARNSYAMSGLRSGAKGRIESLGDISPSESQERIMEGSKTVAQVTTSRPCSSRSVSEDLGSPGIRVTTDVQVIRE